MCIRDRENGVDLRNDKMALQRLKEAAEKAKKELSSAQTTNVNLPFITVNENGPLHLNMDITRAKFDQLTEKLVNDCLLYTSCIRGTSFKEWAVTTLPSSSVITSALP